MASNVIRVTQGLSINWSGQTNGRTRYNPRYTTFLADHGVDEGPFIGTVDVTVSGVNIDLSVLFSLGGYARFHNQDSVANSTNYVEIGIWDGTATFYPMLELLPNEVEVCRLARRIGEQTGAGTGTTGAGNNSLRLMAWNATVPVLIEVFNK